MTSSFTLRTAWTFILSGACCAIPPLFRAAITDDSRPSIPELTASGSSAERRPRHVVYLSNPATVVSLRGNTVVETATYKSAIMMAGGTDFLGNASAAVWLFRPIIPAWES